jgi:hypothetical protein
VRGLECSEPNELVAAADLGVERPAGPRVDAVVAGSRAAAGQHLVARRSGNAERGGRRSETGRRNDTCGCETSERLGARMCRLYSARARGRRHGKFDAAKPRGTKLLAHDRGFVRVSVGSFSYRAPFAARVGDAPTTP